MYNILLQVFDDGRLTDGKGRVVDFTNTVIIATSNLGSSIILAASKPGENETLKTKAEVKSELMEVLRGHFRPEFINRIDDIIVFDSLNEEQIKNIVRFQLEKVHQLLIAQNVEVMFDDSAVDQLAKEGYQPEYGARELRRLIKSNIENVLARKLLSGDIKEGSAVAVAFTEKDGFTVEKVTVDEKASSKAKPVKTT